MIKWNTVTWYSKVLAVVLFVATFYIAFNLGQEKTKFDISNIANNTEAINNTTSISISTQNIQEINFSGSVPVISGSSPIVEKMQKYIDKTIIDFRAQANIDVPNMREKFGADIASANYTIDIGATYIRGKLTESIVLNIYNYTGGANGNGSYYVLTGLVSSGKILSLSDIVNKDKQLAFTELVKNKLNAWRPQGSDASVVFEDEVKNLEFNSFRNWSLDDKNLILYFDKYEIGPGVLGAVPFPLSLDEIQDFLTLL